MKRLLVQNSDIVFKSSEIHVMSLLEYCQAAKVAYVCLYINLKLELVLSSMCNGDYVKD